VDVHNLGIVLLCWEAVWKYITLGKWCCVGRLGGNKYPGNSGTVLEGCELGSGIGGRHIP
jgi:hypothetical protein